MKISIATIHKKMCNEVITKFQYLNSTNFYELPLLPPSIFHFFPTKTATFTMSADTVCVILIKNGGGREDEREVTRENL